MLTPIHSNCLKPLQAANYLCVSGSTLAKWRITGAGPAYVKSGPRVVLYRQCDLEAWLASRIVQSTSQYPTSPGPGRPAKR